MSRPSQSGPGTAGLQGLELLHQNRAVGEEPGEEGVTGQTPTALEVGGRQEEEDLRPMHEARGGGQPRL